MRVPYTIRVELSERADHLPTVQVETEELDSHDNSTYASFEVEDLEPLDVLGPIFSRVFDELGYVLSDPGDFDWVEIPGDEGAYEVTIRCNFEEL